MDKNNYANNGDDSFSTIHFYGGAIQIIELFSFFIWVCLFPSRFYSCFAGCEEIIQYGDLARRKTWENEHQKRRKKQET